MKKDFVQRMGNIPTSGKDLKDKQTFSDFVRMDKPLGISKNLKKIMDEKDLSLAQLSKLSGVPKSTIHNIISGHDASIKTVEKIHKALNVSVAKLLYNEEQSDISLSSSPEDFLSGLFEIIIRKHKQK